MSLERTFSGATIAVAVAAPATYDAVGYAALTWTEFCVDSIPALKKAFASVEKKTTCQTVNKKRKGSAMYDDFTFNFDPADSADGHTILQDAFDSATADISVRLKFGERAGETSPELRYTTAQVGGYAETNGGDEDTIDLKEVTMWIQREAVRVDAT